MYSRDMCPTPNSNRVVTVIIYLSNVETGGGTLLNDLGRTTNKTRPAEERSTMEICPKMGQALVFFPAYLPSAASRLDGMNVTKE
jgi:hypothetical protein